MLGFTGSVCKTKAKNETIEGGVKVSVLDFPVFRLI